MSLAAMVEPVFSTEAVSEATGASLRQLQWWDDYQIVEPVHQKHARIYRLRDALKCAIIVRLREKRISLRKSDDVLEALEGTLGGDWLEDLFREGSPDWILLVSFDATQVYVKPDRAVAFNALIDADGPLVAVALRDLARRLAEALSKG